MSEFLRRLFSRHETELSDEETERLTRLFHEEQFDILESTSSLISNFLDREPERAQVARVINHTANRVTDEIGFHGTFFDLLDLNDTTLIQQAGATAEKVARALGSGKDGAMVMTSGAYSLLAVLCHGRLGKYRVGDARKIFEMAATLFSSMKP